MLVLPLLNRLPLSPLLELEPSVALRRITEQHVLEAAKCSFAAQREIQQFAQVGVSHCLGEIRHRFVSFVGLNPRNPDITTWLADLFSLFARLQQLATGAEHTPRGCDFALLPPWQLRKIAARERLIFDVALVAEYFARPCVEQVV